MSNIASARRHVRAAGGWTPRSSSASPIATARRTSSGAKLCRLRCRPPTRRADPSPRFRLLWRALLGISSIRRLNHSKAEVPRAQMPRCRSDIASSCRCSSPIRCCTRSGPALNGASSKRRPRGTRSSGQRAAHERCPSGACKARERRASAARAERGRRASGT